MKMLTTDYLVIGSGAASLAFVDTLLSEQPGVTVTIVDKHAAPGGHWNDAYGHVRLHQPSLVYGVSSEQLEGNWLKLLLLKQTLFFKHRATKKEILDHYQMCLKKWIKSGRVFYYPSCSYDFSQRVDSEAKVHTFSTLDGTQFHQVRVNVKLVNGVLGECIVPSKHAPEFPTGNATVKTPNQIYDDHQKSKGRSSRSVFPYCAVAPSEPTKYIVMGCGKTGMDMMVYLQREMGVHPDHIQWVVPNDVWMMRRGAGAPLSWPTALLQHNGDAEAAAQQLEKDRVFVRLDSKHIPTKFRFPLIGDDELEYLRKVKGVIRRGRIQALRDESDSIVMDFAKGESMSVPKDTVFVHCTSPGPFNTNAGNDLFPSEDVMNLRLLFAPPVPISMSILAALESRRRQDRLDLDLGRRICAGQGIANTESLTSTQILNHVVRDYAIGGNTVLSQPKTQLWTLVAAAAVMALMDRNVLVTHKWLSANRLSFLSIPGVKSHAYEDMRALQAKADALGLTRGELSTVSLLADKLLPIQGM